jgi:hypothetical protein
VAPTWTRIKQRLCARRDSETHSAVVYIRNIGGGLSLLGFIGIFPFPQFYWWCVGAFYLGLVMLATEAFLENWMLVSRIIVSVVWIVLAALFTLKLVAVRAPVSFGAWESRAEYPPGTVLGNITWNSNFTELRVRIDNGSNYEFENLNLIVRPDSLIARIGQISGPCPATFEDVLQMSQHMVYVNFGSGEQRANPLILIASDSGYRIRCEHLPAHEHLEIVMALADVTPFVPCNATDHCVFSPNYKLRIEMSDKTVHLFGHPMDDATAYGLFYLPLKSSPKNLNITGDYTVLQRPRNVAVDLPLQEFIQVR